MSFITRIRETGQAEIGASDRNSSCTRLLLSLPNA
jgi:hypothetical protein